MNVIYRVHGAGGFYMETQSQDQAFRTARQEAAATGQMALVSLPGWAGITCAGSFRMAPCSSYKLY